MREGTTTSNVVEQKGHWREELGQDEGACKFRLNGNDDNQGSGDKGEYNLRWNIKPIRKVVLGYKDEVWNIEMIHLAWVEMHI